MKVYVFYANQSDIRPGSDRSDTKEIYALTNNKKLYKNFKQTRNMNLFELREFDFDRDKYMKFANHYRECVMEWCAFKSKKKDPYPKDMNDSFGKCVEEYRFAVTYLETQSVGEACNTFFEHAEMDIPNPLFFNKKVKRVLKRIGMDYIFKLTRFPYIGDDAMYCTEEEITHRSQNRNMTYSDTAFLRDDMDFSTPDIWVDQIEVFLEIYGHLMNLDI